MFSYSMWPSLTMFLVVLLYSIIVSLQSSNFHFKMRCVSFRCKLKPDVKALELPIGRLFSTLQLWLCIALCQYI